jgi:GSH-dependent disulfide-bond oxidoreductase
MRGIDLEEFKYFKRWFEGLSERPAVQRGLAVTAGVPAEDPATLPPEEQERRRKLLYNQRARPAPVA